MRAGSIYREEPQTFVLGKAASSQTAAWLEENQELPLTGQSPPSFSVRSAHTASNLFFMRASTDLDMDSDATTVSVERSELWAPNTGAA